MVLGPERTLDWVVLILDEGTSRLVAANRDHEAQRILAVALAKETEVELNEHEGYCFYRDLNIE